MFVHVHIFLLNTEASVEILVKNIKAFLERFSVRSLKMGAIIQFLDELGLQDTKEKMAKLMKTVKVLKECVYVIGQEHSHNECF